MSSDVRVLQGDCIDVMRGLPAASIDAVITDPPYGLEFMGKEWDRPGQMGKVSGMGDADGTPFRRKAGTPAFGASGNPTCAKCGGDKYRNGPRKCGCEAPAFPNHQGEQMRAFQAWCEEWAREAFRVLKPGGHLAAFGGTRTYHRLAAGIEDAGFEIRDTLAWLYGSGFPKSLDVSKAIDKAAGATREVNGERNPRCSFYPEPCEGHDDAGRSQSGMTYHRDKAAAVSDAAQAWQGWGTALKPAHEPITLARKALTGTVAATVLRHGTGALNIDACRIGETVETWPSSRSFAPGISSGYTEGIEKGATQSTGGAPAGRWPANVILDEEAAALLDAQTGERRGWASQNRSEQAGAGVFGVTMSAGAQQGYDDNGGASRFFYTAKASWRDRPATDGSGHPTVKPRRLMQWLVRLLVADGGVVLDPFAGTGSTGVACRYEGVRCILIEREAEYVAMIEDRLSRVSRLHE